MSMLSIETLRAGLSTLVSQQLVLMGTFFVLPVYLAGRPAASTRSTPA